jgi:hypothetical protein
MSSVIVPHMLQAKPFGGLLSPALLALGLLLRLAR